MSKDIINQTIGKNIRYFRKLRGLTLLELGNLLGLSEGTVQRYESGNITNVSISMALEFSKVLDTTPQILMGWEPITYTPELRHNRISYLTILTSSNYLNLLDANGMIKRSPRSHPGLL